MVAPPNIPKRKPGRRHLDKKKKPHPPEQWFGPGGPPPGFFTPPKMGIPTGETPSGGGAAQPPAPDAFEVFKKMLVAMGLPYGADIEGIILQAAKDGYTPGQLNLLLPDIYNTKTFQARFPGWNGRPPGMDVGQYIALENTYTEILSFYDMPTGFYDDPTDFAKFITKRVSPDEFRSRVHAAHTLASAVDPTARGLLERYYGVSQGGIAAYFLDAERAGPALERQFRAVQVGSWAQRNGLAFDPTRFEDLVDRGVTEQMAAQGYATVRQLRDTVGRIAGFQGSSFTQADAEEDVFFNDNQKRRKLVAQEVAAFSGSSGVSGNLTGRRRDSGQY